MKSRLIREIERTIRALEDFASDWERHFPHSGGRANRTRVGTPRRRFAQVLKMCPKRAAAKEMNHTKHAIGDWRVGKLRGSSEQVVTSGE
jgi:hypothetical protein